jgi:hypothetical protein
MAETRIRVSHRLAENQDQTKHQKFHLDFVFLK